MKKRVGVNTESKPLYNKIRLLLRDVAEVESITPDTAPDGYDVIFTDTESAAMAEYDTVTLGEGCDLPLPFKHEDLINIVLGAGNGTDKPLTLSADGKHAYLLGERIKLTDVEYKLLKKLLLADGFVSRDELLVSVWDGECDSGVVNVYVYYLRKKLEKSGNKVIISSRNEGYGIDEKYKGGRG